jgi:drug/metabolite transporter (DMT)-like permease
MNIEEIDVQDDDDDDDLESQGERDELVDSEAMEGGSSKYTCGHICLVIAIYIALNYVLNFSNKFLFVVYNFKYPLIIIFLGTLGTCIGTGVIVYRNRSTTLLNRQSLRQHWKLIAALGVAHAFGAAFENLALTRVSISLTQMVKASAPVLFMLYGRVVERKMYHVALKAAMLVQVLGAIMAVYKNPETDALGLVYVVISLVTGGFISLLVTERLMRESKYSANETAFISSIPSLLSLLILMQSKELRRLKGFLEAGTVPLVIVSASAVCAFFYNIAHFKALECTNSLYMFASHNLSLLPSVLCTPHRSLPSFLPSFLLSPFL